MKTIKNTLITAIASVIILSGCQSTAPKAEVVDRYVSCGYPVSKDLKQATAEAQAILSVTTCAGSFDAIYETLLTTGEGAPGAENAKIYGDFLRWAKRQGIISQVQMTQYYSRYFTTTFVSLPNTHQICYYCRTPGSDKLSQKMSSELQDKQRGMVRILRDKNKYLLATKTVMSVNKRLQSACHACSNAR